MEEAGPSSNLGSQRTVHNLVGRARPAIAGSSSEAENDNDFDVVRQTFRSFRRRRDTEESLRSSKRGRQFRVEWKGTPFLLRRSNPDYFPSPAECRFLKEQHFGTPDTPFEPFNRNWSIEMLKTKISELYPEKSLGVIGFKFGRCDKGKKIHLVEPANVRELEKAVGRGKLVVIPNNDIGLTSIESSNRLEESGTPTVTFTTQDGQRRSSALMTASTSTSPARVTTPTVPATALEPNTPTSTATDTATSQPAGPSTMVLDAAADDELPDFDLQFNVMYDPFDTDPPPKSGTNEMEQDVKQAFLELNMSLSGEVEVTIKREEVVDCLFNIHTNPEICKQKMKVCFEGESGDDFGGLTKEALTLFWNNVTKEFFTGEHITVPGLPLHRLRKEEWKFRSLGRILTHTVALTGALPCRLSQSGIIAMVFDSGVNPEYLWKDCLMFVSPAENVLIYKALNDFASLTPTLLDRLTTFFSVNGLLEVPKRDEIRDQLLAIATEKLVKSPSRFYALMREGIPEAHLGLFWRHLSLEHVSYIMDSQRPTPSRVVEALRTADDLRPQEECVLYFLTEYIRSHDTDDLLNFLLFATASIHLPEGGITVSFVATSGLLRRPVAHTCSNTLEISTAYNSSQEFKREMNLYLRDKYSYQFTLP
ncbi:uncharacterized protein [Apostichopus japonicus]|uniref:uncharacterized protein n=2 Tax=Stichopus japonicus TaxID=307972 RepID=UPI003AB3BA0E